MKLYSNEFSPNCRKVHGVIAQTGLDVEVVPVDLRSGDHKKPEFLNLNPNGKVPVLVDGDNTLWESNSIICFLAGKANSDLWPKSEARYGIMKWMFWESNHWTKPISALIGQKIFNADNIDQTIVDKALGDFRTVASVLNGHLESNKFITGDNLTVADFAVGVWLGYTPVCELPVSEFGHIGRWWNELGELPAWKQMLPPQP